METRTSLKFERTSFCAVVLLFSIRLGFLHRGRFQKSKIMISLRNAEALSRRARALGFDPVQAQAEVDAALAAFPTPDATPTPSPPTLDGAPRTFTPTTLDPLPQSQPVPPSQPMPPVTSQWPQANLPPVPMDQFPAQRHPPGKEDFFGHFFY